MFLQEIAASISLSLCVVAVALDADGDSFHETLPYFERVDNEKEVRVKGFMPAQSILGGDEIVPRSRPYLVSVGRGDSSYAGQFCAGSLISPHAVMTAARCLFFGADYWYPPEWVEFNRHNLTDDDESGVVHMKLKDTSQCDGDAIYHPGWNWTTLDNNVAILFLPEAVTDITPVKLNDDPKIPLAGAPLDVAGWGLTEAGFPSVPSAVTLNYMTNEACTKKPYRWKDGLILDSMMCSAAEEKSQCYGDYGGPVVLGKAEPDGGPIDPVLQVGIVSFTGSRTVFSCYDHRFPNGQTRVSAVVDWVKDTVCERIGELCRGSKSGKSKLDESKAGKSELDKSKAGKSELDTSKAGKSISLINTKNYGSSCVKVPTFAPWPTSSPTITSQPVTSYPTNTPTLTANPARTPYPIWIWTYMPSTNWPTWVPTNAPVSKSGK